MTYNYQDELKETWESRFLIPVLFNEEEIKLLKVAILDTIKTYENQMARVLKRDMNETDLKIYQDSQKMVSQYSVIRRKLKDKK